MNFSRLPIFNLKLIILEHLPCMYEPVHVIWELIAYASSEADRQVGVVASCTPKRDVDKGSDPNLTFKVPHDSQA